MAEWNLDYQYISDLVKRARQGDSDCFAELYLATYKKVYKFALQYLGDSEDAKDATQETYVIVFKKLYTLKDPQLFVSWLKQIAFRVCFNIQKKNMETRGVNVDENELNNRADNTSYQPENIVVRIDQQNFIIDKVMGLPFSESQAIILHYYNDMKIEDIAKLMDISRSSVKRYLASGKQKLGLMIER